MGDGQFFDMGRANLRMASLLQLIPVRTAQNSLRKMSKNSKMTAHYTDAKGGCAGGVGGEEKKGF